MISGLKEYSNKQIAEGRNSSHCLDKKVSNMDEKFSKEMEIMNKIPSRTFRNENLNKSNKNNCR
jgi:hypothetical protein